MAAAVLDHELTAPAGDVVGLDRYAHAFVIARYAGTPVGHAWVPVRAGRLEAAELRREALRVSFPALSRRYLERLRPTDALQGSPPRMTIAVCTRERPDDLVTALAAIRADAGGRHDVLVVDSAPTTTRTRAIVDRMPDVRYVREERPGLNVARNRALREASTPFVAFCDDDAAPEPGWADALARAVDAPLVMCATGLTLPRELETDAQEWFERISPFGRGYFPRLLDPLEASPLGAAQAGAGANMVLRRDVVQLVGEFDERLDAGTPTRSGGDHEFFSRILEAGYRIAYEPRAVSRHRHRRTWSELREVLRGYGVGVYAAWTGAIVERGRVVVLRQALRWMVRGQLPAVARSLTRRPGALPLDLAWAELRGCLAGPDAWFASRRMRRAEARA